MAERLSEYGIEPLSLQRWSPRAFAGGRISKQDRETLFEAARWAPSAFNYQPWQFRYAETGTGHFDRFCDLLLPFNALWARKASLLAFVISDTLMSLKPDADPQPSHSHSFDTGAAWALLALQATRLGYGAHAMTGVDSTGRGSFCVCQSASVLKLQLRSVALVTPGLFPKSFATGKNQVCVKPGRISSSKVHSRRHERVKDIDLADYLTINGAWIRVNGSGVPEPRLPPTCNHRSL